jgi:murein DD-endopeptidase MepM/ murein hydrolase activator NlpD
MRLCLRKIIPLLVAALWLGACGPSDAPTPTPNISETTLAANLAAPTATWTPIPEVTAVPSNTATFTPSSTLTPSHTFTPSFTPTASATFTATVTASSTNTATATNSITPSQTYTPSPSKIPTNTPRPSPTHTATLTPLPTIAPTVISTTDPEYNSASFSWTPPPPENRFAGYFVFQRPFGQQHMTTWARNYAYGSTDRGQRPVHHGVDFPDPAGVAVLAAADGLIYYAGSDLEVMFGPQVNFYGNLVVIEHPFEVDGQRVYSLYGHLQESIVGVGQTVKAGEVIGYVGSTGVAIGAHLHFEVRLNDPRNYYATRNPELWFIPYAGSGVFAGKVTDIYGNLMSGVLVEIKAPGTFGEAYSYTGNTIVADSFFQENVVIPDVAAGYYMVTVTRPDGLLQFRKMVYIAPNEITFLNIPIIP